MRPQQQNRRMRGRNNNNNNNNNNHNHNRKGPNPLTRSYESNGPDVKIRGSAQQIAEKYTTLARDAMSSGDRVMAENYLQHAEHYNRIIAAAQAAMPQQPVRDQRSDFDEDLDDEMDGVENGQNREPNGDDQQFRPQAEGGQQGDGEGNQRNDGQRNDGQRDNNQPRNERREQREFGGQREGREPRERRPFRERNRNNQDGAQDGGGPQPVIEGVPAEVAYGEAQAIQTKANEPAPAQPAAALQGEANGHANGAGVNGHDGGDTPAEAPAIVAAEEPAPKVRRPRRPRTPKAEVAEGPAEAGGEVETAS